MNARTSRPAAMVFIFVTLLIDVLGIGLIIPILPELIKQFAGGETAQAGRAVGLVSATYALTLFLFAPILGGLSDRFGRRPVILISLFGLGVDYLIQGFAPNLWWLVVGRVFAGIMGSNVTTANAYIADISTPENRARNFGLVGVAFGLGFIIGPVIGGVLGGVHLRLPFFVAAALAGVNALWGIFVLPESLPPDKRSAFSLRSANPLGSLGTLRSYPLVGGLAFAFVFMNLAQRGLESTWVLYTGHRFGWDELTNGLTLGLVGLMAVLVQGVLVRPVVARFGERRSALFGFGLAVFSFAGYGIASQGWMMLVVIVVGGLGGVAGPAVQALVAETVSPMDQGKVQGALTSLMSLTSIFAPIIFTAGLFSYFTSDAAPFELPGAPFFLGSLLIAISFFVVLRVFRRFPPSEQPAKGSDDPSIGG